MPLYIFPMPILHGRPYVFGGYSGYSSNWKSTNIVYTFNSSGVWAVCAPMPRALMAHSAVALLDASTAFVYAAQQRMDR